jgi:hypothetical protein
VSEKTEMLASDGKHTENHVLLFNKEIEKKCARTACVAHEKSLVDRPKSPPRGSLAKPSNPAARKIT